MTNIKNIQQNNNSNELFSLYKKQTKIYALAVVAKSTTEPGNSNDLQLANTSTPFYYRAFFVRSTRTPKERLERLSMVACNGKGSPFAVFQLSQFSSPLHVTAQTLESLAVALQKLQLELLAMIYKFLCLNRTKHTYNQEVISIQADSEEQARLQLTVKYRLLLERPFVKIFTNPTACKKVLNNTQQGGVYA